MLLLLWHTADAQRGPKNWFNLDKEKDGINGMSTERTYDELADHKPQKTIIVAVIDGGVDPEHEDLHDIMWRNPGEIAGNGIDDDHNGYIDDVYGWNFIGGKDGRNVDADQLEVTRLYVKFKKKFAHADPNQLKGKARKEYEYYLRLKEEVNTKREEAKKQLDQMMETKDRIHTALDALQKALGDKALAQANLDSLPSDDPNVMMGAGIARRYLADGVTSIDEIRKDIDDQLEGAIDYFSTQYKYHYNPSFDPRYIVGDNYNDVHERYYGNNNVKGPDAFHGTHVAGIIGAIRDNGIGIKGVANNVRIMAVRVVPDGDERDKDVANGIRYAVDNGAHIINMSFGKSYAWNKDIVDQAVKYAEKHGVLLVHAAGNDAKNNDFTDNFPNDMYRKHGFLGLGRKTCRSWMEIGALSYKSGEDAVASFSNYGKKNVDIFAPGVSIYSTTPDNNYGDASGTSMASPSAAGAAALILSYFPDLSARQLKEIIEKSGVPQNYSVKKPGGDGELVPFSSLCKTGATVNIYKAFQLAAKTKGKRKRRNRIK